MHRRPPTTDCQVGLATLPAKLNPPGDSITNHTSFGVTLCATPTCDSQTDSPPSTSKYHYLQEIRSLTDSQHTPDSLKQVDLLFATEWTIHLKGDPGHGSASVWVVFRKLRSQRGLTVQKPPH
ncbi:hypothetical protein DTO282F9_82 [Paecilomyces variotii]|nr:hypothetical protein DTO282F9_82 [Paecilomyces variotii]